MAPVAENETTKSVEQTVPAEEKKQVESTAESSEKNTTSSAVPETERWVCEFGEFAHHHYYI